MGTYQVFHLYDVNNFYSLIVLSLVAVLFLPIKTLNNHKESAALEDLLDQGIT